MRLIDERLKQSDCKVNGWIIDGFPYTDGQIQMLKAAKIKPSVVCMMDQQVDDSVRRLKNRRIDPMTGQLFNVDIHHKIPTVQEQRLTKLKQDCEEVVVKRFDVWQDVVQNIEEEFKGKLVTINSERPIGMVTGELADAI